MIGRLQGILVEKQPPVLLLDVNGVGYEVLAPMSTFYQLPELNILVTVLTHLVVREDQQTLYGFVNDRERQLFRSLIKVNGVGPKLALTILSGIEPDQFVQSIHANDSNALVRIPGIGKKTAERLLIEMRDKLNVWQLEPHSKVGGPGSQVTQDAMSALMSLGYKANDAKRAVDAVYQSEHQSEKLIRLALQQMSRG